MRFLEGLKVFLTYGNVKTLLFNFHYFSFNEASHFPVFLSRNTKIRRLRGIVRITGPLKPGMIRIGAHEIGIYDKRHSRPIWENAGTIIFSGTALIKYGAKIIVGEKGTLKLGNDIRLSSGSFIICYKHVEIGDNCRISWNSQIIDTDFHRVFDEDRNHINPDKEIIIGNNCWIGNHSFVLKGTRLNDMVILASNSMVNKQFLESNVILAGNPAKVIKTAITWGN